MRKAVYALALTLSLFATAGCELFTSEPDGTIIATGRVVSVETGKPIVGLGISLDKGGSFTRIVVATARTNGDGTFTISYDATGSRSTHVLTINDEPYDPQYLVSRTSLVRSEQLNLGTLELEEAGAL